MRIVIIGGRGFIGKNLASELLKAGHTVVITTRRAITDEGKDIQWKHWDGASIDELALILSGCDAVINLAGESIGASPWTKKRKELIYRSRITTTLDIVKSIQKLERKPKVYIQASAIGFYGTGEAACDEQSLNGHDWLANLSQAWEDASKDLDQESTRKIIIRSGVIFGREKSVLQRLTLPFHLFVGGQLGNGRQWISWIHIQDEVRAILFLLGQKDSSGVYNLSAPEPLRNEQMGKLIARQLKRPYWLPLPRFILQIGLGEMSTLVLDGQKVFPKRLLEAGFSFEFKDAASALKDLLS